MPPSQTEVQQIAPSSSSTSPATVTPTVDTPSLLQSADYDTAAPVMATTSSTAATPAAVDDASASSDCNAAVDSSSLTADDEREEQETIIVFDWDDTLLSSSWLAGLGYRLDSNMVSAPASLFAALETLAAAVCELLRLAAQHGRVVVITNAETGWVELSAQKFIPSVVPVLNELAINIFSARSTYEPLHPDLPLKWKSCAFEHVLSEPSALQLRFLSKTISKNVLSLGDSHVEREAVRLVTAEMANTLCKSVKFAERPTCEQLTRQLTLVTNCFSYILNHQNHLDLQLTVTVSEQNQQQAKEEEEKMRCLEQSAMTAHDDGCGGFVPTNNPSSLCMDEEEDEEKVLEAF